MSEHVWNRYYPPGAMNAYKDEIGSPVTLFAESVKKFPTRPCITYGEATLTYEQTANFVHRAAAGLARLGVRKSDRIALLLPNHPAFIVSYYAALQIGAVVVAINPLYPKDMILKLLRNSGARALVTADMPELQEAASTGVSDGILDFVLVTPLNGAGPFGGVEDAPDAYGPNTHSFSAILGTETISQPVGLEPLRDLAALQSTGGTTGTPKFAMLTHANFFSNIKQSRLMMSGLKDGKEVFLVPLPLFHITGTTLLMHQGLAIGAQLVLMAKFDPGTAIDICIKHGVSNLAAVPTIYTAFLNHPKSAEMNWKGMSQVMAGGGPLAPETRRRFKEKFGIHIRQGYGLSECSPGLTMVPDCDNPPENSIGIPILGTVIEIRDPDNPSRVLSTGEAGEICAKGPQVMQGYWNRPDETRDVMTADGFLRTGDVGKMDENGFIEIVDRLKDVIIASGYKLFPITIEAAIYEHPAVSEVAVIGVHDAYRGETAKAFVSLRPGVSLDFDELRQFLTKRLSPMEMPKFFELRPALPKTAVGKISRLALREQEAEKATASAKI